VRIDPRERLSVRLGSESNWVSGAMCDLPARPTLIPLSETATDVPEQHTTGHPAGEPTLTHAERRGVEEDFRRIAEEHRPALHAHCRRMLRSPHDADDAFQETMLRAWRALPRFQGRASLRSWLYQIATNVCIDAIKRRRPRMARSGHGPPTHSVPNAASDPVGGPVWINVRGSQDLGVEDAATEPEARYERRERAKHAFIVAREHLPSRQRNALILRDVLDFSAKESAEILETTVAAINSALQRARAALDEDSPEQSRQPAPHPLLDTRIDLDERFVDAVESGDTETILALLAEDATPCGTTRPQAVASRRD
jgi:RNA polymerase sigma-70 factor (ECF subfamily)